MKIRTEFYQHQSVKKIARDLIGKVLITRINNSLTSGLIVETEAYSYKEKGCHAYNNLRTARTDIMFSAGGVAYVYLCYGIHNLFNIVTNKKDVAEAVLIRALQPLDGVPVMLDRMHQISESRLTSGPGKLTKAMGIDRTLNGKSLDSKQIWLEDIGIKIAKGKIKARKRIGIDYAGQDAELPWRFVLEGNDWISKP